MRFRPSRQKSPRRGVTLVEMLVAVALLVLMMTIIVQVFAAATGAVSAAKIYQDLDQGLSAVDLTIRSDLNNISAKLTPPLNPADNLGYFEYGENSFADLQGEDIDDYLRFTAQAPEGKYFTGKMYISPNLPSGQAMSASQVQTALQTQPITITSQTAEIIYFLRNGNLYRRVLLVAPERQSAISQGPPRGSLANLNSYSSSAFPSGNSTNPNFPLGWQGVNDLSARPAQVGSQAGAIALNTLGNLTNRENRFAYSRFADDFVNNQDPTNAGLNPDGLADDENLSAVTGAILGDGIHDYYPSLYFRIPGATPVTSGQPGALVWEISNGVPKAAIRNHRSPDTQAFPYVFPGAYSKPDPTSDANHLGLIHTTDPTNPQSSFVALNALNHNPLDLGDSLPTPSLMTQNQTWFGFPTWRETLSPYWTDPTWPLNSSSPLTPPPIYQASTVFSQPNFLHPYIPGILNNGVFTYTGVANSNMLPPMTAAYRPFAQLFNDQIGDSLLAPLPGPLNNFANTLWTISWEDDLILSNVRSFDVKAYDNSFPGYVDLGWGDDLRALSGYYTPQAIANFKPPLLFPQSTPAAPTFTWPSTFTWPPPSAAGASANYNVINQTYAHEGRMPPLIEDLRFDAVYGASSYPGFNNYPSGNIGDDNNIVRLRRVWDTWSTDYAIAPATGYDPTTFAPIGPPFSPPVYPSYPAPYPMPLRGIQIQIRVVDPANQRPKVLTIRQDFSDKL